MGNHRADRRTVTRAAVPSSADSTRGARATGGKRKASRRRTTRPLPAAPALIGAAAILAAAGGAVAFGQGDLPTSSSLSLAAGGSDLSAGSNAFGFVKEERARAISRDSERQALEDAASKELQAAIEEQSAQRNAALASLAASAEKRADQIAKNLWVSPMSSYRLTARFGATGLWSSSHTGLDFAGPSGTAIRSIANGVVTSASYDGAYGNKTVVTLADGTEIWYCHQSTIGVNVGDKVVQGDQIGTVGTTGHTTGPHLHLEVRPGGGDPVDPYRQFIYHGATP